MPVSARLQIAAARSETDPKALRGNCLAKTSGNEQSAHECYQLGLALLRRGYPEDAFDYVVLSQTIQATQHPRRVLEQMLRIGHRAIVSFPNFGHWRIRRDLLLRGRMPVTANLPHSWYETPNIHFCTIRDFADLCAELNAGVERRIALGAHGRPMSLDRSAWLANLLAEQAVFVLHRAGVTEPGRVRPRPGSTPAPD